MRPGSLVTLVLLFSASMLVAQHDASEVAGNTDHTPVSTAAQQWVTPWDVFLGCRGIEAEVTKNPAVSLDPASKRVQDFCALDLPRIGTRFTRTELSEWREAIATAPDMVTWNRLRLIGEEVLLARVKQLGRISVGGTSLRFDFGSETLSAEQRQEIRRVAESLRARHAVDTTERVDVSGYADLDNAGNAANREQARKRAAAVVSELMRNGIDSARIVVSTQVVTVQSGGVPLQEARAVALNSGLSGRSLASPEARPTRAGGADVSTLLVGTTDFLVEEAREQIENYLLQQGARRICNKDEWARVLRATCVLIPKAGVEKATADSLASAGKSRQPLYFPGLELVRDAIREDLRSLPYRVGSEALKPLVQASADTTLQERAALALYLLRFVEEIGRTGTPLHALQSAHAALIDSVLPSTSLDRIRVVREIRRASTLASLLASAREDFRVYWQPEVLADSGALYAMKALALNAGHPSYQAVFPGFDDGLALHVEQVLSALGAAQGLLVSIEKGWVDLRRLRQDSTFAASRGALAGQILSDAVDLAVVTLPRGSSGQYNSYTSLVVPVRALASALAQGDAPQALTSLLQLSREVQANGGVLNTQQVRVLAFATDIAQARQTDEVQAAFQRLVGDGPGYQGKRNSTERFWRVNAYAGLSAAGEYLVDADDVDSPAGVAAGFTLPVGVEVGWPAGAFGSHGVLVQLVDLGAIASARIGGGNDVESFPEFSLGSVVAPGVFYVRSMGGSPFTLLAGGAYVPQARQTEAGRNLGGFRLNLGAAIDVPIFP